MSTVIQSSPPVMHKDHSYSIDPPPGPGCRVEWFISGEPVTGLGVMGGLKVDGITSTLSVEVTGDITDMTVSATVICPPPVAPLDVPPIDVVPPPVPPPPPEDIAGILLDIAKYPTAPAFLLLCLICRGLFGAKGSIGCDLVCWMVPYHVKKALGLLD